MKGFLELEAFSRGFLRDALTLMKVMDKEGITQKDIKHYIGRRRFGKPVGSPKPFTEKKNLGCKGCKEKEK